MNSILNDVPAGEKVVFFTRDPVSRFISGFYSRKDGDHGTRFRGLPARKPPFPEFSTPNELALGPLIRPTQIGVRQVRTR